jgi:two-component system sensor histidine kinase UhpB
MNKAGLSLRVRLMASIAFALTAGLGLGGALIVWQARQSVANEIDAAFIVGRQTIAAVLETLPESPAPALDLRRLIAVFDGNRHVRVALIGDGPATVALSTLAETREPAPGWFVTLIGVPPRRERITLPQSARPLEAVSLETDSRNEVLEVWNALRETAALIVVLVLCSGLLIWWAITRVLRPFSALSAALRSVGAGEFEARLPSGGLPETQLIAAAFNRMAEDLSAARERNRALYRQLLSAQEAERKDLARDLHDDIGPLLLAVSIDAAAAEGEVAAPALHAIGATISQAQQHIRAIVNRLRPIGLAEFGLRGAVENLVVFWQRRHPEVIFTLDLGAGFEAPGELAEVTAFRIVQEALNNALRHGAPSRIRITFRPEQEGGFGVVVSDDGKGAADSKPGFGLTGMQERVEAAGGRLVTASEPGGGFTVTAVLPRRAEPAT